MPLRSHDTCSHRVRFVPNEQRRVDHTDTIYYHTVVGDTIELLPDDGAHSLSVYNFVCPLMLQSLNSLPH